MTKAFGSREKSEFINSYLMLLKDKLDAELPDQDIEMRLLMQAGSIAFEMSTHIVSAIKKPYQERGY